MLPTIFGSRLDGPSGRLLLVAEFDRGCSRSSRCNPVCTDPIVGPIDESSNDIDYWNVHPWNFAFCALLGRIIAGRSASEARRSLATGRLSVAVLPSFVWVLPQIPVGRKGIGRDNTRILFPARIVWGQSSESVVCIGAGNSVTLSWSVSDVGVGATGTTTVTCGHNLSIDRPISHTADPLVGLTRLDAMPTLIETTAMTYRSSIRALDRIVTDGESAMWDARLMLEGHAKWMLQKRRALIADEINPGGLAKVFDETDLEVVSSELLLGNPERNISPAYDRIINRCLSPQAFARVDPMHRVMASLGSCTESALRRRIGDPHVGRKIRKLFRDEGFETLEEFLSRYRELWPRDAVGVKRVADAVDVIGISAPVPSGYVAWGSER